MFRHVVLFTWKDEATLEQRERVAAELRKLPDVIKEIRSFHLGPDAGVNQGNHDFAVVADFDSAEDYLVYRDDPTHRAVIADHIAPILASRAAVQYAC
ncbi:hypothetical protein Misp01_77390 [Microtetraspora sp. NBRC 13810]|uniref:Dabb family protein n=1 Tax=Microtetraspora sp. NBRC 13810 TaxID=3030990 RepID=UPI0024A511C8|nr:Dabb family protein [Microtetraspora sp. NBRC 13810]GLW12611.1 hypothetical protein Misp01_77390 [Microtetraspora sp. NBRC 13810]